jgi:hypothetical protein
MMHAKLIDLTVAKLRPAKYNPRTITDSRLNKLSQSLDTFGDLSGVVFNIRTGNLVSGHQRMKTVGKSPSKIVQKEHKDDKGTVSVGHIDVKTKNGHIKIPFRAVDWDIRKEKAANVAANAHGGAFDKEKLTLVLADLENVKEFDLDIVGLDPLTLKSLRTKDALPTSAGNTSGDSGRHAFKEYGEDIVTKHECPKCHFRFG